MDRIKKHILGLNLSDKELSAFYENAVQSFPQVFITFLLNLPDDEREKVQKLNLKETLLHPKAKKVKECSDVADALKEILNEKGLVKEDTNP